MTNEYVVDKVIAKDDKTTWNTSLSKHVEMPKEFVAFLKEYQVLCKKYNITLGHEDGHGGFHIEPYDEGNIEWVAYAIDTRTNKFEF